MTDDEATLLAGIPNAPSVYSLTANPDLAAQRQQYVLQQMVKYGYLGEEEGEKMEIYQSQLFQISKLQLGNEPHTQRIFSK